MSTNSPHLNISKFTRGEKCIFAHVVFTFAGILAIVIIYYGHICLVQHRGERVLAVGSTRATGAESTYDDDIKYRCVGAAYVFLEEEDYFACGTAALRPRWSLAPARCVAARASPHLAHLLPHWTLLYDDHRSGVRRGVAHPNYQHDGAGADIGLFELEDVIAVRNDHFCAVPGAIQQEILTNDSMDLFIVGWREQDGRRVSAVTVMPEAQCTRLVAPVVPTVSTSLCLSLRPGTEVLVPSPLLGSMVFEGSQLIGITSWGSGTENSLPIIAVDIAPFTHWLDTSMKLLLL